MLSATARVASFFAPAFVTAPNGMPGNGNGGIVPPGRNGNTGVVGPNGNTGSGDAGNDNTGIVPPRPIGTAQVEATVRNRVQTFLRGTVDFASPVAAPLNPERYPSCNANPMGEMGVNYRAYNINGELLLCRQGVVPGAKPTWFDLGAMPSIVYPRPMAPAQA